MSSYKTDAGTLKVVIVDANGNTIGVGTMSGNPTQTEAGTLKVVLSDIHGNELATDAAGYPLISPDSVSLNAQGLISQNIDRQAPLSSGTMIDGTAYAMLVPLMAGAVAAKISIVINSAGSGMTLSKVGLYDTSGNRLAVSADQGTAWETPGTKTISFSSAYTVPTSGGYYVVIIAKASTTLPKVFCGATAVSQLNGSVIGSGAHPTGISASQTDLGSSLTFTFTASLISYWVGVS